MGSLHMGMGLLGWDALALSNLVVRPPVMSRHAWYNLANCQVPKAQKQANRDDANRSQFCEVINLLLNIDLCRDRDRIVRANEPDCIVYSEGSGVQRPPQGRKHTRSKSVISGKAESKHCSPAAGFGMKAASTSLRHRAPGILTES